MGVVALRRLREQQELDWQMVIEGIQVFGVDKVEQGDLRSRSMVRLAIV